MNLLKRIWKGRNVVKEPKIKEPKIKEPKIKEPKIKEPKIKEPLEVTRRGMVDRLFDTDIQWGSKLTEEVKEIIFSHINMVKSEWSISFDLVPSICLEQSLRDHIEWLRWTKNSIEKKSTFPSRERYLTVIEGDREYFLSWRQISTYIAALIGLEKGEQQNFFHEFSDCIHNYEQNIHEPINPAEKQALAAMMYYFFQKKDLTF